MKPKILHILYSGLGGTTDYVFNLIKGDKNKEFEHHILFYGIEEVPEEQLKLAKQISKKVTYVPKQKGYDKIAYKKVLECIIKCNPSTITLHVNSLILTCSKYKQAKLIFVEHQANHLKTKKEWIWSILAQKRSNHIVTLTKSYQNELKQKLKFLYVETKNELINSGLVLGDYISIKTIESSIIKIGMISRINSFRDHETLVKAFNLIQNKNIELHIAGDGPLLNQLRSKNNNKNITFYGNIQQSKIPSFLSGLDIYCHASLGETSSVAIMQAQASGLPIIASNVKGINNVLTKENCVFVQPQNIDSYVSAIKLLIKNKEKRKELSKKSMAYTNINLSHFRMFDAYKKLFEQ